MAIFVSGHAGRADYAHDVTCAACVIGLEGGEGRASANRQHGDARTRHMTHTPAGRRA